MPLHTSQYHESECDVSLKEHAPEIVKLLFVIIAVIVMLWVMLARPAFADGTSIQLVASNNRISANFDEPLTAAIAATVPEGSDDRIFFLSVDADKAVITGDGVTIDDDGNVTVIDEGDNEVTLHKADGGYWFSLDDTEVNASTTFLLPLASTVNDTDETANSVTLRMRAGHGIDTNSARRDAETKEQMVFVWSSNGDALHYGIHLEWVTNDESKKYT